MPTTDALGTDEVIVRRAASTEIVADSADLARAELYRTFGFVDADVRIVPAAVDPLPPIRRSERQLFAEGEVGVLETPWIAAARLGCPAELVEQAVRDGEIDWIDRRRLGHWRKYRMVIRCADVDAWWNRRGDGIAVRAARPAE